MRKRKRQQAMAWVLRLVIHHQLCHTLDDGQLAIAIELLKAVRDDPKHISVLFERWGLDPDKARLEAEKLR